MLYQWARKGPFKVSGVHDPDSKRLIELMYRPDVWTAQTVYLRQDADNYDIVIPSEFKGFYYKVDNPGKSGTTEPDFAVRTNELTEDFEAGKTDGLVWKAVPYNLLPLSETLTSIAYTATNGVTVSSPTNTGTKAYFTIDKIPSNAVARVLNTFAITAHFVKSNGEEDDVTLQFKIAER